MANSFSRTQLERFRREAKKLGRESSITHSEALDRIAIRHGFTNWSLLVKHSDAPPVIAKTEPPSSLHTGLDRYYLHGDVVEGEPGKCYCARCDMFCDLSHFQPLSWHKDGEDGELFLSSLARWNKLTSSGKGGRHRPADAKNVLQLAAEAARAAREAARSPFHYWLERQCDRDDEVGDLARDAFRDERFPVGASTRHEVEYYLSRYGDHVIRAVRQAWREFRGSSLKAFAQFLAEELDIDESEAKELVDVEPQELTGSSGEMTYGYRLDFTEHASPKLRAKLLKKRGSLQLEVGPSFFETVGRQGI